MGTTKTTPGVTLADGLSSDEVRTILKAKGVTAAVALLGIRGMYGGSDGNDRGEYDDLIAVATPQAVTFFRANTDPSVFRKGIAVLQTGVWLYRPGIHGLSKPPERRYRAFVQAAPVVVKRDSAGSDTGWFGINIHRGGSGSTSSLGCQTIPPDRWEAFRSLVYGALDTADQATIPYALTTRDGAESILRGVNPGAISAPVAQPGPALPGEPSAWKIVAAGPSAPTDRFPAASVRNIAGYNVVPVRAFLAWLLRCDPSASPVLSAGDTLLVNGYEIEDVEVQESVTWAHVVDVANSAGFRLTVNKSNRTLYVTSPDK